MALNNYKNNAKKDESVDDGRSLLCTEPGCGRRWSINLGSPKCSFHQWNDGKRADDYYGNAYAFGDPHKYRGDPKGWAKRIVDQHEAGWRVSPIALKFAKEVI